MSTVGSYAGYDRVHPLKISGHRIEPFPTTYWLRDGDLHRAVADLERQGWIKRLEKRVAGDEGFAAFLKADHARYAAARWAMLDLEQRTLVTRRGWVEALRDRGVGGVADFTKVKCLHAHVAHALADRAADSEVINVTGAWALERIA
ncbi:MAG: DUF501 domain-containing protein [Planctomycetota bacterium]